MAIDQIHVLWRCTRVPIAAILCMAFGFVIGYWRKPQSSDTVLRAIKRNDMPAIEAYLRHKGDPEIAMRYVPACWARPVHLAAQEGQLEIVRLLLDAGANPNSVCSEGESPLHWLTGTIPKTGQLECARLLLDRGADPGARDREGFSLLHTACAYGDVTGLEIAKLLIERGADVNAVDANGQTPLHALASRGPGARGRNVGVEVARMLLDRGASTSVKDRAGRTALDIARESQYTEIVDASKVSQE